MANHITRRQWRLTWFDWEEKSSVHGATITEHENRFKVGHWDAFRVMWDAVTNPAGNIMLKCFHFFNWRDSSHWRDSSIHSNCAGRKRANRKIFQRKKKNTRPFQQPIYYLITAIPYIIIIVYLLRYSSILADWESWFIGVWNRTVIELWLDRGHDLNCS